VSFPARFNLSLLDSEMFMAPSRMSPADAQGSMLGNTRLLALCTWAALAFSAGCSPDTPTVAGPDAQLDQTGPGAGGQPGISLFTVGATQISGLGRFAGPAECNDPEGQGADYDLIITGDLEGCHYIFVESANCTAGGAYSETGTETFVGLYNGASGTFGTTYLATGKYTDCANLTGQLVGRCQHPIVAGSGEGVFAGVAGRLDMRDDVETGTFSYRGHFRWAASNLVSANSAALSSGTVEAPPSLPGC
jgi:hypothetical protein